MVHPTSEMRNFRLCELGFRFINILNYSSFRTEQRSCQDHCLCIPLIVCHTFKIMCLFRSYFFMMSIRNVSSQMFKVIYLLYKCVAHANFRIIRIFREEHRDIRFEYCHFTFVILFSGVKQMCTICRSPSKGF